jgi:dihydroorotate dehydrogenase electron transfer subunit
MSPEPAATPSAVQRLATVVENVPIAHNTYRLRLEDTVLAGAIRPGQFLMIRPGAEGSEDPLLGRPFALYDVVLDPSGSPWAVDVVYLVIGRGTSALARRRPGDRLSFWGPLGNGFNSAPGGSAVFVAGGIGQTPFLALGRSWMGSRVYGGEHRGTAGAVRPGTGARGFCHEITLLYGVRTAALLAGLDDFREAGIAVEVATDDGTAGHRGLVTDLLAHRLDRGERPSRIVGCGPPAMLAAVSRLAQRYQVPCDVSLENHMACGFGVCFSCVAPIRTPAGATDLRRVCVEGPVFAAEMVDWSAGGGGH